MTNQYEAPAMRELGDLLEPAKSDPCIPCRNFAGHFVTCNFGDWPSFDKCDCAGALANAPKEANVVRVSPMPLRDHIAALVTAPEDDALELASAQAEGGTPTLADMAMARAWLRYLEADAMIAQRAVAPRFGFDPDDK